MAIEIGQKIHDKLITDLSALTFETGGGTLFGNVKKFYATGTMAGRDCLIVPDSNDETVVGQSAGNTQTTREYGFKAVTIEVLEASDTDAIGAMKYSRLINIQDVLLNYLQKEPSNLNAWGNTNGISIYKIRVRPVRWDTQASESGYVALMEISFGVYLNIIPQNL